MSGTGDGRRTWYVVSDTAAQIVNLVPAAVIGLETIDHVLTLQGVTPRAVNKLSDYNQAGRTHDWLRAAFEAELRHRQIRTPIGFETRSADKDDLAAWEPVLMEFFAAQKDIGRIVYVYTGGTRDMMLGIAAALDRVQRELHTDASLELVTKQALRLYWPRQKREVRLANDRNRLSLDAYLRLHGFEEPEKRQTERLSGQRTALDRRELTRRLGALVFQGAEDQAMRDRILLLNRIPKANPPKGREAAPVDLSRIARDIAGDDAGPLLGFVGRLAEIAGGLPGVTFGTETPGRVLLRCEDTASRLYLAQGGWFEEWVWLRTLDAAAGTQAEVALNLKVRDCANPQPDETDVEIDVAIHTNDELYLVECKTDRSEDAPRSDDRKEHRKAAQLHKLQGRKSTLSSVYGEAWLCDARPLDNPEAAERSADRYALNLVSGPAGIELMLRQLRRRVQPQP